MSEPWQPKVGDPVKYTASRVFPAASRGEPVNIRKATITKVTQAGFVYVSGSSGSKFERSGQSDVFVEVRLKKDGMLQYSCKIERPSSEELAALPTSSSAGSAHARRLREQTSGAA
jgi:hypothetical protein